MNESAEWVRRALYDRRFLAADRAKLDVSEIGSWDPYLLRDPRLLVPIDVQALYVPVGSDEPMVRLPMALAYDEHGRELTAEAGLPEPFTDGTPREPGVHLHWAMPDALLRGQLDKQGSGAERMAMPVLPDRWVVLRLTCPADSLTPELAGWVLLADRAAAVPLADFTEGMATTNSIGMTVEPEQLTGIAGGSVTWSGVYDAVRNRFAFHDPLDGVTGVDENCATYVVAGWWSSPKLDPLDAARSNYSLHELLHELRWGLHAEWGDAADDQARRKVEDQLRHALGLPTVRRWDDPRPVKTKSIVRPADAPPIGTVIGNVAHDRTVLGDAVEKVTVPSSSAFANEAVERYLPELIWQLRSSLLHGVVFGVPVAGDVPAGHDHRPDSAALGVAIGVHDDDVLAAFAGEGQPEGQRRNTERLLAAFTSQKVDRLASADGVVDIEEHEHAAGFSSLTSGYAGTDRYLQRRQSGGAGGLAVGKFRVEEVERVATLREQAQSPTQTSVLIGFHDRPDLKVATALQIHDVARSRVGDVLTATEERVVDRPAARFTFPDDPMVAVRGLRRSLRHGGDGRAAADGLLQCRWPTQVINEVTGVIAKAALIRSVGNGGLPPETLELAREAMLLDPYHLQWLARAVSPDKGFTSAILTRLRAESVLRFGGEAVYDNATVTFDASQPRTRAQRRKHALFAAASADPAVNVGVRQEQVRIADELHRFSLYAGADPDLVGVTAWSQPWIPMWLEWEISVAGLDPPTIEAWTLGQLDGEIQDATIAAAGGESVTLRGRSVLTTGGARTLHDAITDWLAAEDSRGADREADTDAALQVLANAVQNLDLMTAALDGVRSRLLGLPVADGVATAPVPVRPPAALLAGTVRLSRARIVDAFGRTVDVPVDAVAVPTRLSVPTEPGALAAPPRLLRPARWQLRLVDAVTRVGTEGVEARVDEVQPELQVSPVAGFVLPDHLDESLEVFAADGSPLGELLHEPVSGGVLWEIAAGREGPADAGPGYGLTPAQESLGHFAAGLVAADAANRGLGESALSAMLRAIDTTLWTVDTLSSLGTEHVAGLVGRPLAVVRAQLRLELKPPTDIDLTDPARAAEWAAAERLVARYGFTVRIGEVTRSDDGVLGFFIDDDYSRFRLVDKAIAGAATDSGRSRGQLGLYGQVSDGLPARMQLDHPYVAGTDDADTLTLHCGQTVTLTILMHPAGRAHLTSGVLPRRSVALARNWVGAGLAALAPSLRTGPVLVETDTPDQVRMPKVSVFGKDQNFLWRDTPATWRTDAILAATQTALLPDTPAELREGWVRVAPPKPNPPAQGTT